jgi:hypothetical protein
LHCSPLQFVSIDRKPLPPPAPCFIQRVDYALRSNQVKEN